MHFESLESCKSKPQNAEAFFYNPICKEWPQGTNITKAKGYETNTGSQARKRAEKRYVIIKRFLVKEEVYCQFTINL